MSLKSWEYTLLGEFIVPNTDDTECEYWGRRTCKLHEQQYVAEEGVAIDAIAFIKLNDKLELCEKVDPGTALHTLYPYVLDAMHADVVLGHGLGVFDGSVSRMSKEQLYKGLSRSLENTPTYSIFGPSDFAVSTIASL